MTVAICLAPPPRAQLSFGPCRRPDPNRGRLQELRAYLQPSSLPAWGGPHSMESPAAHNGSEQCSEPSLVREMGGAPRNPALRNQFVGVDCQANRLPLHRCFRWRAYLRVPTPLRSSSPFSERSYHYSYILNYLWLTLLLLLLSVWI